MDSVSVMDTEAFGITRSIMAIMVTDGTILTVGTHGALILTTTVMVGVAVDTTAEAGVLEAATMVVAFIPTEEVTDPDLEVMTGACQDMETVMQET